MNKKEAKTFATELAACIFADGRGRRATRLAMEFGDEPSSTGLCERAVADRIEDHLAGNHTCPTSTPSQNTKTTNADGSSSSRPRTLEIEASGPARRMIAKS
jgi:hypothetical protein